MDATEEKDGDGEILGEAWGGAVGDERMLGVVVVGGD